MPKTEHTPADTRAVSGGAEKPRRVTLRTRIVRESWIIAIVFITLFIVSFFLFDIAPWLLVFSGPVIDATGGGVRRLPPPGSGYSGLIVLSLLLVVGLIVFPYYVTTRWNRARTRAKRLGWMSCPVCQYELPSEGAESLRGGGLDGSSLVLQCPECGLRMSAPEIQEHWSMQTRDLLIGGSALGLFRARQARKRRGKE